MTRVWDQKGEEQKPLQNHVKINHYSSEGRYPIAYGWLDNKKKLGTGNLHQHGLCNLQSTRVLENNHMFVWHDSKCFV